MGQYPGKGESTLKAARAAKTRSGIAFSAARIYTGRHGIPLRDGYVTAVRMINGVSRTENAHDYELAG